MTGNASRMAVPLAQSRSLGLQVGTQRGQRLSAVPSNLRVLAVSPTDSRSPDRTLALRNYHDRSDCTSPPERNWGGANSQVLRAVTYIGASPGVHVRT